MNKLNLVSILCTFDLKKKKEKKIGSHSVAIRQRAAKDFSGEVIQLRH